MRIISGFLKGKKIKFLKNLTTRPLKDSVKENIFNILIHSNEIVAEIENSNVLDLYSGIGSFGMECISRGANKVTFVEKEINALNTLRENLNNSKILHKAKILSGEIKNVIIKDLNEKFNIFFFDPPFKDNGFLEILQIIKKKKIFFSKHIVVIHRDKKSKDNFKNLVKIIDIKEYGRSKIILGFF